ncbi:molybdopterin-dependent oxidoreductase [Adlercreutzia equolifaciens]|uniref:molybdopterin-dependent oxidoreductase n=1 Tax=Adlercreutzia equolifaciens TaxID=446660 RepID=UPI00241CF35F|nr:molybdopterin-dependent oxidoreductase [Adlercreutzia equolifaciens]
MSGTTLNRRSFLKWSTCASGAAALASLTACAPADDGGADQLAATGEVAANPVETEGTWRAIPCGYNGCGGACVNYGLVKDGVVVRQMADCSHEDSADFPLRKGCLRGRAMRKQVYGEDRIDYPLKRKHWQPGGVDVHGELRGIDEWERISWDEALDLVAGELKRVRDTYGNGAIVDGCTLTHSPEFGGNREIWGVNSEGDWPMVRAKMAGTNVMAHTGFGLSLTSAPDRFTYKQAKLIVMWGQNPSWSSMGMPTYNYQQAREAGAKFIIVAPNLNATAVALGAEWIPCRPSTDTALLLAMAYHMIENNLQDQEFLDSCCVGFDAEHMPEGVDPTGNFKDYVLGTYDGTPKTPEWASEICGTPVDTIRSFAEEVATVKPTIFQAAMAPARTHRGHQFGQAFLTVGWMTGNFGIPGGAVVNRYRDGMGGMNLIFPGNTGEESAGWVNPCFQAAGLYGGYSFSEPFDTEFVGVTYDELWDAILTKKCTATVRGVIDCDIRMYFSLNREGNHPNQKSGTVKAVEALRSLETVVACDIVLSNKSKYADIILPGTTVWEEVGYHKMTGDHENIIISRGVGEPMFEHKDIATIENELADRLGITRPHPLSAEQRFFNLCATTTYFDPTSEAGASPLVTITQDDIDAWGVEGAPQEGLIGLEDFLNQGGYAVERHEGDMYQAMNDSPRALFRSDPAANPADTESGKLEIYCQSLATTMTAYGFDETKPIPVYEKPDEGVEDTYADWDAKVKGDYPLQMVTVHYIRRSHSSYENVKWLQHAHASDVLMNRIDAEERGLENGDSVLVTSRHGKVARKVHVVDYIMPGVVELGQGAWFDFDEETGIDMGGCTNTLCGARPCGQGMEPFNSLNVQVEKWTGEPLVADYLRPARTVGEEA